MKRRSKKRKQQTQSNQNFIKLKQIQNSKMPKFNKNKIQKQTKQASKIDSRFKKDARFRRQQKQHKPKLDERFASKLTSTNEKNIDKYGREIEDDQFDIIKQNFDIEESDKSEEIENIENLSEKQLQKMIEEEENEFNTKTKLKSEMKSKKSKEMKETKEMNSESDSEY